MSGTSAVRVGGQALADGVFMRTDRAWAIAREDGSLTTGAMPPRRWAKVPVVRVLAGMASALRLAVGRGMLGRGSGAGGSVTGRRRNRRVLVTMVAVEISAVFVSHAAGGLTWPVVGTAARVAGPWVAAFAVLRAVAPKSLWRYHGAEHKAVAAHEAGVDLGHVEAVLACPRVHDRCGTNLVFLAMLGGTVLSWVPAALQVPAFLVLLAGAAEVVSAAAGHPRARASRLVLAGGRALQRRVTTAEPSFAQQAVGCRALAACLEHHDRLAPGASPPSVASAA